MGARRYPSYSFALYKVWVEAASRLAFAKARPLIRLGALFARAGRRRRGGGGGGGGGG